MAVTFPKIGSKHNFTSVFDTSNLFRDAKKLKIPRKAVFVYQEHLLGMMKRDLKLHRFKALEKFMGYHGSFYKSRNGKLLVIKLQIGAPLVAVTAEEIIHVGVKEIVIMGTAGSLHRRLGFGSLVLCTKAVRDEGTSHHYIKNSEFVAPSLELTDRLGRMMKANGIKFIRGPTWSIDAPYRETPNEVIHYKKKGILTVEMEAAALFAVAKVRKTKAAAVLTVSDILDWEEWSGFAPGRETLKEVAFPQMVRIAGLFAGL